MKISTNYLFPLSLEVLINLFHEFFSSKPVIVFFNIPLLENKNSKILGHVSLFNSFNDCVFKAMSKLSERIILIKLCSVQKTSSPGKD